MNKEKIKKIPFGYIIFIIIAVIAMAMYFFARKIFDECTVIFSAILMLFIYYMIIRIYKLSNFKKSKNTKYIIISIIAIILIICIAYICYLITEKNIKTWDNSCYWSQNIKFANYYNNNLTETIKSTINSVNNDEYNLFPSLLLNSLFKFTDQTFLWYVMSVYFLFLIPVILLYNILILKMLRIINTDERNNIFSIIIANIPFLLSPILHFPIIKGYLDVLGLIFVLMIINLLIDYNFEEYSIEKIFLLIIATTLLVISRRYFSFWILAFYSSYAIINIASAIINKEYKKIGKIIITLGVITIGVLCLLVIKFRPMILRILESNFTNLYIGYKNGGFLYQIFELFKSFSFIIIILSILGYILAIIIKRTRKYALIMITTFVVTTYLFSIVQTMDSHHKYLILLHIIFGISMLILTMTVMFSKRISYLLETGIGIIILINLIVAISIDGLNPILSAKILAPEIRNDYEQILKIRQDIEDIIDKESSKIYIIAASDSYNSETFQNIYYPDLKSGEIFVTPSNVDLTHGFRTSFYESNYVMTVTPIQYHLKPEHERCVTILYNAIEENSPLSDNYELIKTWHNVDNITINLYRKNAELVEEDKQYLAEQFNIYYPEYPELFYNRIMENSN